MANPQFYTQNDFLARMGQQPPPPAAHSDDAISSPSETSFYNQRKFLEHLGQHQQHALPQSREPVAGKPVSPIESARTFSYEDSDRPVSSLTDEKSASNHEQNFYNQRSFLAHLNQQPDASYSEKPSVERPAQTPAVMAAHQPHQSPNGNYSQQTFLAHLNNQQHPRGQYSEKPVAARPARLQTQKAKQLNHSPSVGNYNQQTFLSHYLDQQHPSKAENPFLDQPESVPESTYTTPTSETAPILPSNRQAARQSQEPHHPYHDLPKEHHLPREIRAVRNSNTYEQHGRTIVVLLDGTGDKFDADNSNIVHLVSCIKKSDPSQITYYQSGIGTYDGGGVSNGINAAFDMAVGSGLGVHVRDAYAFLQQTYKDGDKICLFGFSRGAYTARCLGGMIHKVGLLPAHNQAQLPFAYDFYKDDTEDGWKTSQEFKRTFCMDVNVYFVGCFDSVASVGFIPRRLPLSSTPTNKALYFRHALALDERRAKFKPCRYASKDHLGQTEWKIAAESGGPTECDVLEVWFAGCHCDVGGGAVKNEERHKLSQIPLRWMIRQCFECDTGIIFKSPRLAEEGLDVHTLYPEYKRLSIPGAVVHPEHMEKYHKGALGPIERRASLLEPVKEDEPFGMHSLKLWDKQRRRIAEPWIPEQTEDYFDAISPLKDQLTESKPWWILEFWPIKVRVLDRMSDEFVKKVSVNKGRFRCAPEPRPNLHWSVQRRAEESRYEIRVRTAKKAEWQMVC